MIQSARRLLITGGGTGGHIFPGLSVARYLIEKNGWKVYWLGSWGHLEADIVPKYGIEIKFIRAVGFSGRKWYIKFISLFYLCISVFQARSIISSWNPDIILGMGGYVSVSVGIAAWFCRYPMILHEQNSIAGFANRVLAMTVAKKVLQGFSGALSCAETVGNPIRDIILSIKDPESRLCSRVGPIRLLIMGGSQGARIFNHMFPKILAIFLNEFIVWHQVGKGNLNEIYHLYGSSFKNVYKLVEFIDDIASAYEWADIIVCRSGALTVSEIACVGIAAIFVPFLHKDYHQYWNALPLQKIGAAKIIHETEFTIYRISEILYSMNNRSLLLEMAKRARILGIPDATKKVAYEVINQSMN